jgi:hypothetical protein
MNNMQEMTNMEINLDDFDKDTLIRFIIYSHVNNLTFNEALNKMLKDNLPKLEKEDENQLPLL